MVSVDMLLQSCVAAKATILDIRPGMPPQLTAVGDVWLAPMPPLTGEQSRVLCLSIVHNAQEEFLEEDGELDFDYVTPAGDRFTVHMTLEEDGISALFMKVPEPARVAAGSADGVLEDDRPREGEGGAGVPVPVRPKSPVLTGSAARPLPPDDELPPYMDS
jgi:hypothetical protein